MLCSSLLLCIKLCNIFIKNNRNWKNDPKTIKTIVTITFVFSSFIGSFWCHFCLYLLSGSTKEYELELTQPSLLYDYTIYMLCRRCSIFKRNICLMYNYRLYDNIFWIFLIPTEYSLQSMYNHMVGQATSVVSPLYFILLGDNIWYTWRAANVQNKTFIKIWSLKKI